MKRVIALILAFIIVLAMSACEKKDQAGTTTGNGMESIGTTVDSAGDLTQPGATTTPPATTVPPVSTVPPTTAHTHSYTQTVTAPSCTAGGHTTNTCACGDSYRSDEKAALGHSWTDATCTAPKTCTVCKATEGAAKGHSFTEGKCTVCGAQQENYKPLNSGKWQGYFLGEDGRLYNLNLWFLDSDKRIACSYGVELSTLDPEFQKQLLANPTSLVEFEGKKYYIGMGDGMDITVAGGDHGGYFEVAGFSAEETPTKVYFDRIAGDQIKISHVDGNVFGSNAVKQGVILTWSESEAT